ncbi:MAG: hypothetical protein PHX47_03570 [Candidatus ainarchaeum sp.]|nr:hypothetical protein [Candidatus ainarchaeum sp.]
MNNKTKIIASILTLFSFLLVLGTVSAYRGDLTKLGPNYDPVVHANMQSAIEAGDYQAWNNIVSLRDNNSKITTYITEENFEDYSKAYLDAINGNPGSLQEFRASLGLGQGNQNRGTNKGSLNENPNSLGQKKMNRYNSIN